MTDALTPHTRSQQPVTISGSDYSAVSSWVGTNSLWLGPGNITDPLNNFMYAAKSQHPQLTAS